MTRIFSHLAGALAMLTFAGCGDVPSGGATVATNTAALKPLAPAAEDKDMPVTPLPLVPSALPPVGPSAAQTDEGQLPSGQPANNPAFPGAVAPAAPPADSGGGLLQSLLGDPAPAKAPARNASGNVVPDQPNHIVLIEPIVTRISDYKVHFEFAYRFDRGGPIPTNWYSVHLHGDGSRSEAEAKFQGTDLQQSGNLAGEALAGSASGFQIWVVEGTPKVNGGYMISEMAGVKVGGGPGHEGSNPQAAAPPSAPPASSSGGLLQGIFGDTSAPKTPATGGPANPPAASPAGSQEQIVIAGTELTRTNAGSIHFDITYSFAQGQPVATNWYTVAVREHAGASAQPLHVETKIEGSTLQQHGHLTGNIQIGGRAASFDIHIIEAASHGGEGRQISDVFEAPIHRDLTGEGKATRMAPAGVGVGAQGKGYGDGIVTTPVATLFTVKETIAFKIQIPQAMKFFEAQNNRKPTSNEEFMEKIIKDNQITLPELPAGEKYIYDPQAGELMYTHPKE